MNRRLPLAIALAVVTSSGLAAAQAATPAESDAPRQPPYRGTIFIAPDIYLDSDPSTFESLADAGTGTREMFDRRVNGMVTVEATLFNASFADGLTLEVRVNPEFPHDHAEELARHYMQAFGQLPTELRRGMENFNIHDGNEPFGGGGRSVLVHTGMGERYLEDGILAETLFHETVHATIDDDLHDDPEWRAAQRADPTSISTYAEEHPDREDLAETLLMTIAVDQRPERLPEGMADLLHADIPHRLAFFRDRLAWNVDPTATPSTPSASVDRDVTTP